MKSLATPQAMRAWSEAQHRSGRSVGLVPTMGALHGGHLALVEEARRRADAVVVSIFVNPRQFDRPDDFARYPRPIDEDLAICVAAGVDAVYAPSEASMYPPGYATTVHPGALAERLEGAARPGHFAGVATVVAKLFTAVRPQVAVFGAKDFQQLAVVRRMAADLDLDVEVLALPTVRDDDGLAMSSRNLRLTAEQRAAAICVPRSLAAVQSAADAGTRRVADLCAAAAEVVAGEPLARLEYVTIVDPDTLEDLDELGVAGQALTAVWFGDVRLIDNMRISGSAPPPSPRR
jgi:pantoate--beta-alanine ligase